MNSSSPGRVSVQLRIDSGARFIMHPTANINIQDSKGSFNVNSKFIPTFNQSCPLLAISGLGLCEIQGRVTGAVKMRTELRPDISLNYAVCNNRYLKVKITNGVPPYSYTWYFKNTSNNPATYDYLSNTDSIYITNPNFYKIFVKSAAPYTCFTNSLTQYIQIKAVPAFTLSTTQDTVCLTGCATHTATVNPTVDTLSFRWRLGTSTLQSERKVGVGFAFSDFNACKAGKYSCTVTDPLGCTSSKNFTLTHTTYADVKEVAWQKKYNGVSRYTNLIKIDLKGNLFSLYKEDNGLLESAITILKDSPAGVRTLYVLEAGLPKGITVTHMEFDLYGNVYVFGKEAIAIGSTDLFIRKYDANGDLVWAKKLGETFIVDVPKDIKIDDSGDLYILNAPQTAQDFVVYKVIKSNGEVLFTHKYGRPNTYNLGRKQLFVDHQYVHIGTSTHDEDYIKNMSYIVLNKSDLTLEKEEHHPRYRFLAMKLKGSKIIMGGFRFDTQQAKVVNYNNLLFTSPAYTSTVTSPYSFSESLLDYNNMIAEIGDTTNSLYMVAGYGNDILISRSRNGANSQTGTSYSRLYDLNTTSVDIPVSIDFDPGGRLYLLSISTKNNITSAYLSRYNYLTTSYWNFMYPQNVGETISPECIKVAASSNVYTSGEVSIVDQFNTTIRSQYTNKFVQCTGKKDVNILREGILENDGLYDEVKVFPNPFSTDIKIEINLSQKAFLDIEMYNASGIKVASITKNNFEAGIQTILFNREENNLPAGIYLIKTIIEGKVKVKTIVGL